MVSVVFETEARPKPKLRGRSMYVSYRELTPTVSSRGVWAHGSSGKTYRELTEGYCELTVAYRELTVATVSSQ